MVASWIGVGFSALLLSDAFEEEFKQKVAVEGNCANWKMTVGILIAFGASSLMMGFSMTHLAVFHIWLRFQGLTTYTYHNNRRRKPHVRISSERTAESEGVPLESVERKGNIQRDPAFLSAHIPHHSGELDIPAPLPRLIVRSF